jgi:hypothetical protein
MVDTARLLVHSVSGVCSLRVRQKQGIRPRVTGTAREYSHIVLEAVGMPGCYSDNTTGWTAAARGTGALIC